MNNALMNGTVLNGVDLRDPQMVARETKTYDVMQYVGGLGTLVGTLVGKRIVAFDESDSQENIPEVKLTCSDGQMYVIRAEKSYDYTPIYIATYGLESVMISGGAITAAECSEEEVGTDCDYGEEYKYKRVLSISSGDMQASIECYYTRRAARGNITNVCLYDVGKDARYMENNNEEIARLEENISRISRDITDLTRVKEEAEARLRELTSVEATEVPAPASATEVPAPALAIVAARRPLRRRPQADQAENVDSAPARHPDDADFYEGAKMIERVLGDRERANGGFNIEDNFIVDEDEDDDCAFDFELNDEDEDDDPSFELHDDSD